MKEKCFCNACGKELEVDFMIPPTEEDKLGWHCEDCAEEKEEE